MQTIEVVKKFSPKPYGRYQKPDDPDDRSGERFRKEFLAPELRKNDKVHVVLDGYNRYGRSFLDEAFGGLIRYEGFTKQDLDEKLIYTHSLVESIVRLIDERIEAAEAAARKGVES